MKRVLKVSVGGHKSLLQNWRMRQVWYLHLECGHTVWRYRSRFPEPPKRAKCKECEALR